MASPVPTAGRDRPGRPPPAYERNNNFDLLRAFLAYAVVAYHTGYLTGHDRFTPASLAGVAVGGFFVISGFPLTWSLDRSPDLKKFALKRFFRIYPLYALVILVQTTILVAEVEPGATGSGPKSCGTWGPISCSRTSFSPRSAIRSPAFA